MTDNEYLEKIINIKKLVDLYANNFCWIYPFTNENIEGYYSLIDFKDKDGLTVTSSGDHAINALLYGAKNVDTFDSNPLAKYYSELKISGIKSLSLKEFINFFYNKNIFTKQKDYLDKNTYNKKIREYLTDEYKSFWDYALNKYSYKELYKSYLFTDDFLEINALIEANPYFKNYKKTKEIIINKNINYYTKNIKDLSELNKVYDVIILSNIPTFLEDIYDKNALIKLKNTLEKLKHDNTKIVLNYYYYNMLTNNPIRLMYNNKKVREYFKKEDYKYHSFECAQNLMLHKNIRDNITRKDKVLISK